MFTFGKKALEAKNESIDVGFGEPLVLLHGLFGNLSNWQEVTNYFKGTNRVLVPTLPLFGREVYDKGFDALVEYLKGYLEEKNLQRVTLIGNSLGGHVATLFTVKYPAMVKKLVLSGSSGLYENINGMTFPRRGDYNYIQERVQYTFKDPAVASKELVDEVYEIVNDFRRSLNIVKIARHGSKETVGHLLKEISVPTLLIWGKDDKITPVEVGEKFHEGIRNSSLILMDDCGHAPMMEHPLKFNQLVASFLKENSLVA